MSQAWSLWGPARMWAPTLVGQGEAAAAPSVPREAWEGGSLCPAHRELTHRAPDSGGWGSLALGDRGTGDVIGGGGHKRAFGKESGPRPSRAGTLVPCHRRGPERVMRVGKGTGAGRFEGTPPESPQSSPAGAGGGAR